MQHPDGVSADLETAGLDRAQKAAAAAVAGDQPLVVVVGPAGTGKTTALRPALATLAGEGRAVFAVAPTATTAAVLSRGGMFEWLVEHGPAVELDRVHWFVQPWERDASLDLRRGRSDVLNVYEWHGRLHRGEPGEVDSDVVDRWWELRGQGQSVAVLAANNDTVHRLNQLAQTSATTTTSSAAWNKITAWASACNAPAPPPCYRLHSDHRLRPLSRSNADAGDDGWTLPPPSPYRPRSARPPPSPPKGPCTQPDNSHRSARFGYRHPAPDAPDLGPDP